IFDRRNQSDVDRALVQQLGASGWDIEPHVEGGVALEAIHQGTGVEIADRSETNRPRTGHAAGLSCGDETCSNRPMRATGVRPAARMLRVISSSGARRRPSPVSSAADTESTSSAPTVSATCASFGPYSAQSTWIDGMLSQMMRASATRLTSS